MPRSVRAVRVLMYVVAGLTAVLTLSTLITLGVGWTALIEVSWFALPGIVSFVLAWRIKKGGVGLRRWIIGLEIFYVVVSLTRLVSGDPRGLVNLVLPAVVLVLITRPAAKEYFRKRR
jgi:hypothetical protein